MTWPTKTDFVDGDVLSASQMNNIGSNLNVFNPTSATNGQLLVANGAGSAAFQTVATGGLTSIATGNLTGASVTISSIPGTYKSLQLWLSRAEFGTNSEIRMTVNGNTTSDYYSKNVYAGATSAASQQQAYWVIRFNNATTSYFVRINLHNYTSTGYDKGFDSLVVPQTSSAGEFNVGNKALNAAITSLTVQGSVNWSGGTYTLYGVS